MQQRPLHEEVRPGRSRDQLGTRGELFAKLADALEKHAPDRLITKQVSLSERAAAVTRCFEEVPALNAEPYAQDALAALQERAAQ